jgi:hypothetical protein
MCAMMLKLRMFFMGCLRKCVSNPPIPPLLKGGEGGFWSYRIWRISRENPFIISYFFPKIFLLPSLPVDFTLFPHHVVALSPHPRVFLSPYHLVSASRYLPFTASHHVLLHHKKRGVVRGEYGWISSQNRRNGRMSLEFLV